MKTKIILLGSLLISIVFLYGQTVPNGGFESWTNNEPDSWTTNNVANFQVVSQAMTAHSGSYAVKLQAVKFNNNTVGPEIRNPGSTGPSNPGFPISQNYSTFSFWYTFDDGGNNELVAYVTLRDTSFAIVGSVNTTIDDDQTTYKKVILPISYTGSGAAAYGDIQFLIIDAVGGVPDEDAWAIIDDVELSNASIGIDENMVQGIDLYPNPANDKISFALPNSYTAEELSLRIVSANGHVMKKETLAVPMVNGARQNSIDVSSFPDGVYFIQLEGQEVQPTKFIVQH